MQKKSLSLVTYDADIIWYSSIVETFRTDLGASFCSLLLQFINTFRQENMIALTCVPHNTRTFMTEHEMEKRDCCIKNKVTLAAYKDSIPGYLLFLNDWLATFILCATTVHVVAVLNLFKGYKRLYRTLSYKENHIHVCMYMYPYKFQSFLWREIIIIIIIINIYTG